VVHDWIISIAAGVVFGAIASATDPASTIDVLWEYRSAGVLTTAIVAIVALDDALAMTLYGLGTSAATILTQSGGDSVGVTLLHTGIELGGAILLGVICGFVLNGYPSSGYSVGAMWDGSTYASINPLGQFLGAIIMFGVLGMLPGYVLAKILNGMGKLRIPREVEIAG